MALVPRRASLKSKYVKELRVDTTGFLHGAVMKEVPRSEGLYNVQVAEHPVAPTEGLKWWLKWYEEIVEKPEKLLPLADVRSAIGCAVNSKPQYLAFREYGSGVGFRRFGFYERVFIDKDGNDIEAPTKGQMIPANMRYVNLYTMEVCSATTYAAVKLAAEKGKVWYFTEDVVDLVKYELKMEVYKLYIDAWHVWTNTYGLMYHEVMGGEVLINLLL